ncbi:class I adenylate-forming enzyme family protein [Phenylobacterium sp.]|uniref:class I adenylate-forming enzyme family protein n=1 Tax=Phenylobacterium sp. TaxID=1871053 RepID=UPI00301C0C92
MFDGFIRDNAAWTPRAPAVILPGRRYSYAAFDADIDRLGSALAERGLGPVCGVVAVAIASPYLQLLTMAALARLGICGAPGADPGADLRLTDSDGLGEGPPVLRLTPDEVTAILAAEPRFDLPQLELDPDALGHVMLSSGTTRSPRRVGLTWRRLEAGNHANLRSYAAGKAGTWAPVTGVDSMLGFSMSVAAWSVGGAVAWGFRIRDIPALMEQVEPGIIGLTPRQLRELLTVLPDGFLARPEWRICAAGALLPAPLAHEARLRLTPDVRIIYGSTEASLLAVGHAADLEEHPGLVGRTPAGAILEVVDDDGRPLPDGETGEFRITSERMSQGYLDDPEASAERFRDGWFHTRDLGRRLPDGRLILEGRVDDRLNLGGLKLMPQVVEQAAYAAGGVADCAAFAAPGTDGVEQCWLAVVAAPGGERDRLAALLAARADLPPVHLAWIDTIPRNAMGKVERGLLRGQLLAALLGGDP